jgi:ActR/RegA family two-component response regulator
MNPTVPDKKPEFRSVLLVDDDRKFIDNLRTLFQGRGHEAIAVYDGDAAIEQLKERAFDVILLDLRMPRTPGLTVLPKLLAVHPEACVVVLTGYGSIADAVTAVRLGAAQLIEKKHVFRDLYDLVGIEHDKHEDRLRARKAERDRQQLDAMKDYIGVTLHNMKNILSPIAGSVSHVRGKLAEANYPMNERFAASLDRMDNAYVRVMHVLDKLKQFVTFGTHQTFPVDLSDCAARGKTDACTHRTQRERVVTVDFLDPEDGGTRLMLAGDAELLTSAVENIFQNALDCVLSPKNDTGRRRIAWATRRAGNSLVLTIANSGPRLPDEIATWLNAHGGPDAPLAKSLRDPDKQGTSYGIGLYTAARTARAFGGTLTAAPCEPPDDGTVFTFTFPALAPGKALSHE